MAFEVPLKVFISGDPANQDIIDEAAYFLHKRGYKLFNNDNKVLAETIAMIMDCDAIYMIDGWEKHPYSLIQNYVAVTLGKEIMFPSDGIFVQ